MREWSTIHSSLGMVGPRGVERGASVSASTSDSTSTSSSSERATRDVLHSLTLEAGASRDWREWVFTVLNRTLHACAYDRAVLWRVDGGGCSVVDVSGQGTVDKRSPSVQQWRRWVGLLRGKTQPLVLDVETAAACVRGDALAETRALLEADWRAWSDGCESYSAAWLPVLWRGEVVAGLWLERWSGERFTPALMGDLVALSTSYGMSWAAVCGRGGAGGLRRRVRSLVGRRWVWAAAACVVFALLFGVRTPLRIVAPCEVAAADPVVVTAPLEGVIEQVHVGSGDRISRGQVVASYDLELVRRQFDVARQQAAVIASDLQRTRAMAFEDAGLRSQSAVLANRLAQERLRVSLAGYQLRMAEVAAPSGGVVLLEEPESWRGRPVQVGQRICTVADPSRTEVVIWLPESDNIAFDRSLPVRVMLDANPEATRLAMLERVDGHSQVTDRGMSAFRAKASWLAEDGGAVRIGLRGTAVLYGPKVSLGYWLVRRPLGWIRSALGV